MLTPRPRATSTLVLAGVILALTAMAGPDSVQHLRPSAGDFHECALYHWAHGAGCGSIAGHGPAAPLLVAGEATLKAPAAPPEVSAPSTSSRAPPAIV